LNRIFKPLFLALACLLLVFPNFVLGGSDVSIHNSFTWETDLEWNSWSLNNIETNGSNTGIRLSDLPDGGYQSSGEATYKFSPGGNNKWIKATLDTDDPVQNSAKYIWVSVFNKNSVSQINPDDGSIVKEWNVGMNPSRTTIGCNNDAWVLNRGWGSSALPSSVSHIIPAEDKVITHKLPYPTLTWGRSLSIQCTTPNYIWVGANGYVIKINTASFDALSSGQLATAAQVGNTVTVWAGEPYATYGSVLGSNADFLYVASWTRSDFPWWTGSVYGAPTYKINTSTYALVGGGFPAGRGHYVITNDWLGNVWRDGVCVRIDPGDASTDELCANGSKGISILPANDLQGPKIAYVTTNSNLCVGDLQNNNTNAPTVANLSCTTYQPLGGIDVNGVAVSGGGLGYDNDYDIWFLARKGTYIAEFKQSENYAIVHRYSPTDKAGGGVYSYADFLGNALDNSTDASISPEYSTDGINFFSVNADGSFPGQIEPSADLYIRVGMAGSGTNSPLLRSLKIEYDPEGFSNLRILRTTHTSSLSRDSGDEESTFERGEVVYTRIKLFEPERARDDISLTDRFSNVSNPRNFRFKSDCTGAGQAITPQNIGANQVSLIFDLPLGLSCIDYEYTAN